MASVTVKELHNNPCSEKHEVSFSLDTASRLLDVNKAMTLMNFFRDEALKAVNVVDGSADVTAVGFHMEGSKLVATVLVGMIG